MTCRGISITPELHWNKTPRNKSGVTLVELMISTFIVTTIFINAILFISNLFRSHYQKIATTIMHDNANTVMNRLVDEFESAGSALPLNLIQSGKEIVTISNTGEVSFVVNNDLIFHYVKQPDTTNNLKTPSKAGFSPGTYNLYDTTSGGTLSKISISSITTDTLNKIDTLWFPSVKFFTPGMIIYGDTEIHTYSIKNEKFYINTSAKPLANNILSVDIKPMNYSGTISTSWKWSTRETEGRLINITVTAISNQNKKNDPDHQLILERTIRLKS